MPAIKKETPMQGLLDQPEGEPVAWMTSIGRLCSTETTNLEQGLMYGWQPLYPHPVTPITADDVTAEMIENFYSRFTNGSGMTNDDVIAAAINTYLGTKK